MSGKLRGVPAGSQEAAKASPRPNPGRSGSKTSTGTPKPKRRPKFLNQPVDVNGLHFDSKAEGARYMGLYVAQQMGEIRDLEVHPRFPLVVRDEDCGDYIADFSYVVVATGERIVEDVKSPVTRKLAAYRLKVRLLWAVYGIRVREVGV